MALRDGTFLSRKREDQRDIKTSSVITPLKSLYYRSNSCIDVCASAY
jgi:hypothetical protein